MVSGPFELASTAAGASGTSARITQELQEQLFPTATSARGNLIDEFLRLSQTLPGGAQAGGAGSGGADDPILAGLVDTIRAEAAQAGGTAGAGGAGGFIGRGIRVAGAAEGLRQNRVQELFNFQQLLGQPNPQVQQPDINTLLGLGTQQQNIAAGQAQDRSSRRRGTRLARQGAFGSIAGTFLTGGLSTLGSEGGFFQAGFGNLAKAFTNTGKEKDN